MTRSRVFWGEQDEFRRGRRFLRLNHSKIMKKKFALFPFIFAAAAVLPACAANSVSFDGHPESVAEDDDVFYVACIGKTMAPTEKDGDGFIATMNARGKILSPNAFPNVRLDAPKGAIVEDGVLYVADVDRVVAVSYSHLPLPTNREV